jgi:hypothetical protein
VQIPAKANNILSDEVQHWVNTNLTVYSTVRTVLQHCQRLVNWELSQYEAGEKLCNRHAVALLEACQYWEPHLVGGVVCACAANAMIPWLVSTFANGFPLAHDDYQLEVPGDTLFCYCCVVLEVMLFMCLMYKTVQGMKRCVIVCANVVASLKVNHTWTHKRQRRRWRHVILCMPSTSTLLQICTQWHMPGGM